MKNLFFTISILLLVGQIAFSQPYTMPDESLTHEGTWLQWPHQYQYGATYRNRLDATWVAMTAALVSGEKVHIVAYDATEQTRITALLNAASVPLTNVDFSVYPTDDVWVRDNGPIFVRNSSGALVIQDWGFNAWGGKFQYTNCNTIPTSIATALGMTVVNLNSTMVNEGGSVELDGHGVLLACKSSILSQSPANTIRNADMTQAQAEAIFTTNLGVSKFIWLNGVTGLEVTDMHIDGFARFANPTTIVTMSQADLLNWGVPQADINTLMAATNTNNTPYTFVTVPLTQNNVTTAYGKALPYKGSYANYYIGNTQVLVPNYNDPNDAAANAIIQALYPTRTVVGIDVRNLYENGGMVHCVTQQQPVLVALPIHLADFDGYPANGVNVLKWTTASEENNSHFEIERSQNGTKFEFISKVTGAGTTQEKQLYTYSDTDLLKDKTHYYRLKQVDFDGKETYSKVVAISDNKGLTQLKIYPNPTDEDIEITGIPDDTFIEIYNELGQLVKAIHARNEQVSVSLDDFKAGLYFVKLIREDDLSVIETLKFIKK
ncbi:MAG: agmatine deiminase family protein [Saprospiraceae bacterium]|nr:agmatine deiminase family protein [Saprospiraceae bacterium]